MAEEVCKRCGGSGSYIKKHGEGGAPDTYAMCHCAFLKDFNRKMLPEIAIVRANNKSPLFTPGEPGEPAVVDRTTDNLFLKGYMKELAPHIRWALMWKHYEYNAHFYTAFPTDLDLKTVWVGDKAYKSRSRKNREAEDTANGLMDIIGPDKDLVIIRLGYLGHPNRAMPGILREALLYRSSISKPIWIIEQPSSLFRPGHHAWSEETEEYIKQNFEEVNLSSYRPGVDPEPEQEGCVGATTWEDEGISVDRGEDEVSEVFGSKSRYRRKKDTSGDIV